MSGIVQRIKPRDGASWQSTNPPPQRRDDSAGERDSSDSKPERAPPEPGTGELVDRTV